MFAPMTFSPAGASEEDRRDKILRGGFHVDILVHPAPGIARAPLRVAALIDTGATKACLDYQIAQEMGLIATGQTSLHTANGRIDAPIYAGVIEVPDLGFRELIEIVAPKLALPTRALLGRSFLQHFVVTFDGPGAQVTFARRVQGLQPPLDD